MRLLLNIPDLDIATTTVSDEDSAPPVMETQPQLNQEQPSKLVSFRIWPPTQRTRNAVIDRLIETLSTPSVLSKRYGTMTPDDASSAARRIEDEAFATAAASAPADDDGIEIIQLYSKEISKLMLDIVKARVTAPSPVDNGATATSSVSPPADVEAVSATES